jgi:hypothetical protein
MKELGDLRGAQVPGLGWLGQRALPFVLSSPVGGTTLRLSGSDGIEGSTQVGMLGRPVVAGSGCSRYCAPGTGSRLPRNRRSSLSLAVGTSAGPTLVDTSKTVEGGTST